MLFDEQELYFARDQRAPYQQGDILIAPTGCFEEHVPPSRGVRPGELGAEVRRQQWSAGSLSMNGRPPVEVPATDVAGRLCPAMIVTHDCTLEKEFNRAYERLRREGWSKRDATETANSDPSLDRFLNVVPLVPHRAAAPSTTDSLVRNNVLGYFPVCPWPEHGVDEGVVDLSRVATIDKHTVVGRLAVISSDARRALMFALAKFWVFRAPTLAIELEAAVRQRIRRVDVSTEDSLLVEIELQDGSTVQLIQPPAPPDPGGVERSSLT